ncbi:hypothetical protein [Streptomyces sp. NPDC051677]|uniref:hypothetical protein n=1 Tax=Streptomyces sp. NPDC051677 TaxID=3365669 RepID=UPI0037D0DBF7
MLVGIERLVAVDVIADGHSRATALVAGLVDADDGPEAAALQDAVGFGVCAASEDLTGVGIRRKPGKRTARSKSGGLLR